MQKKLHFFKLQASGNDFVLIENRRLEFRTQKLKMLSKRLCQRKFGVGADGLLVIEPSKRDDFSMRIFNPDGSEAEMCGNGARCTALWAAVFKKKNYVKFSTKAGVIESKIEGDINKLCWYGNVMIKMGNPFGLSLGFPINIGGKKIKVNYINTGVPHTIVFVEGLEKIDVEEIGRKIRYHRKFMPSGTNVDFVEVVDERMIKIRTYERGIETETLACGTGVVASAIISSYHLGLEGLHFRFKVLTRSGDTLGVYFTRCSGRINDVWLKGRAYFVYSGEVNTD